MIFRADGDQGEGGRVGQDDEWRSDFGTPE